MESSEYSSSDPSSSSISQESCAASSTGFGGMMYPPAPESVAPQNVSRSRAEWSLVKQSQASLTQTLELVRVHLGEERFVYEVSKTKKALQFHMCRIRQKHARVGSINGTLVPDSDVASLISTRSFFPQTMPFTSQFVAPTGRAPVSLNSHMSRKAPSGPTSDYFTAASGLSHDSYAPNPWPETSRAFQGISRRRGNTLLSSLHETMEESECASPPPRPVDKEIQRNCVYQTDVVPGPSGLSRQGPRKALTKRHASPDADSSNSDSDSPSKRSRPVQAVVKTSSANQPTAVPKIRNIVTLKDWRLTLIGEDLGVVGTDRNGMEVRTGAVTRFIYPTIHTARGQYKVEGKARFGKRASEIIVKRCNSGFPRQWKALREKWLAERQQGKSPGKTSPDKKAAASTKTPPNKKQAPSSKKKKTPEKRLSKSMDQPRRKRNSLPDQVETKNQRQRNPVKQKEPPKRSRSEEQKPKKNGREVRSESESYDSEDEDQMAKRPIKKRGSKVQPDSEIDDSEDSFNESPGKRPVERQEQGSDTSWDRSANVNLSSPRVTSKKQLEKCVDRAQGQRRVDKPSASKGARANKEYVKNSPAAKSKNKITHKKSPSSQHPTSNYQQPDSEGDESEDSFIEAPRKKPVVHQDQGSDTSWDCSTSAQVNSSSPKVTSKKQINKCVDRAQGQKRVDKPSASKEARTNKKIQQNSTTAKNEKNPPAAKTKNKQVQKKAPPSQHPTSTKQSDEENHRPAQDGLFSSPGLGDDEDYFSSGHQLGGRSDDGFNAGGRSMTPNALLKSCGLRNVPTGRFTPPLQSMQHLFNSGGRNKRIPSALSSPSSSVLNSSRKNPVVKRMTKNVTEASKKRPNKKAPGPSATNELDSNPEYADIMNAFRNTNNNVPTPSIIKKHFRPVSGSSDDEDPDESQVY